MDKKLILIIDDSSTNIVLLATLLIRSGYEVVSARGAMEGISKIRKRIPDLIYLDLVMPDIDGFRFMEILKEHKEWCDIPIVMLSAIDDREIKNKSLKMGVSSYITKPISIDKIAEVTEKIIKS